MEVDALAGLADVTTGLRGCDRDTVGWGCSRAVGAAGTAGANQRMLTDVVSLSGSLMREWSPAKISA